MHVFELISNITTKNLTFCVLKYSTDVLLDRRNVHKHVLQKWMIERTVSRPTQTLSLCISKKGL